VSAPLVSVALLTRNGEATLPAVLDALARQRADFAFEILAIDSGSTDGTVRLLERSVQRLLTIPPTEFNHGLTRNLAIEQAAGALVVLLVQDAIPAADDWLDRLTAPLRRDPSVAGAFCRQKARRDASALSRTMLESWVAGGSQSRSVRLTPAEYHALAPYARLVTCAFDNVCSCIRRAVWSTIPFVETTIAEDLDWAKSVLLAGYQIDFVADAAVEHSHNRSSTYEFARTYLLHRRLFELFELRTIPSLSGLCRAVASSSRQYFKWDREATRHGARSVGMARALALGIAWPLGQYLGGLSAAKGWKPLRFENV
jgi:rhamnosyltransferase